MAQAYEMVRKNKEQRRAKEVEPDGHGEVTHDHELHLHKLASISSMMIVP